MAVGIIGGAGHLGRLIVSDLESQGCEVVTVEPRRNGRGRSGGAPTPARHLPPGRQLLDVFAELDAVVIAAPLTDPGIHRSAVRAGCHVVDVAVDVELNRGLLALDPDAIQANRSVIAMAGLIGLSGLLGAHVVERFSPTATTAAVALIQSPTGTAGEQGTREMLDMLTRRDVAYRHWPIQEQTGTVKRIRLFDLHNTEPQISELGQRLQLGTEFDGALMQRLLRAVRLLRLWAPPTYAPLRDAVARRKARTPGRRETTRLSAVALDAQGTPVGGRLLTLTSDYGATAAIAAATALTATDQQTRPGAGHLRRFLQLEQLLLTPLVQSVLTDDTGNLPAKQRTQ